MLDQLDLLLGSFEIVPALAEQSPYRRTVIARSLDCLRPSEGSTFTTGSVTELMHWVFSRQRQNRLIVGCDAPDTVYRTPDFMASWKDWQEAHIPQGWFQVTSWRVGPEGGEIPTQIDLFPEKLPAGLQGPGVAVDFRYEKTTDETDPEVPTNDWADLIEAAILDASGRGPRIFPGDMLDFVRAGGHAVRARKDLIDRNPEELLVISGFADAPTVNSFLVPRYELPQA